MLWTRVRSFARRTAGPVIRWLGPLAFPTLAVIGAGAGALLLFYDGYPDQPGDEGYRFVHRGPTALWIVLLLGQTAFWAVLAAPLAASVYELRRWRRARFTVVGLLLLGISVYAYRRGVETVDVMNPLPNHEVKMKTLTYTGGALAFVAGFGMWCVWAAADRALAERRQTPAAGAWLRRVGALPDGEPAGDPVERYLRLRSLLERLLALAGAIVGAAILGTGALRNAILSWEQAMSPGEEIIADEFFADELVLAYGLFLSALLALFYAGPALRLQKYGEELRDAIAAPSWPPALGWESRAEERTKLSTLLQLDLGATTSFRAGVAILAPLATSIVGVLLGGD